MASKRELIKEFGPKIIEIYGEDELKFLRENFSGEELEKYIKQDHDSFKGMRNGGKVAKKEKQKGGKIDISPKFIGLKKIRNKVKELGTRFSFLLPLLLRQNQSFSSSVYYLFYL